MDVQEIREKIEEFIKKHTQTGIGYILYITPQHEGDLLQAGFTFSYNKTDFEAYPVSFLGYKDNVMFIRNTYDPMKRISDGAMLFALVLVNCLDGARVSLFLPTTFASDTLPGKETKDGL